MTWVLTADAQRRVGRSLFVAAPDIWQDNRFDVDQFGMGFRKPLVGSAHGVLNILVLARTENSGWIDLLRNKILELEHALSVSFARRFGFDVQPV